MKTKRSFAASFSLLVLTTAAAQADTINWVGSPGGNFFDPANWDDGIGPDPDNDLNTAYDGDIIIEDGFAQTSAGEPIILASGRTFTVTNSTVIASSFQGVVADNDADSVFNVSNSTIICNNIANDAVFNLTGNSKIQIFAAAPAVSSRNSINGVGTAANGTRVNLGDSCSVVHENGNDAGNAGAQSVGQRIIRTASGTSFATDFAILPLTEFDLSGASAPFSVATTNPFTIAAKDPNPLVITPQPEIIIGFRLAPPEPAQPIWYPTYRTNTDWQINLVNNQIAFFGFVGITDCYLADLNGDGLSDKVMRQTANGGSNPSQVIATYTLPTSTGFTTNDFNGANGDIDVPFGFLSAADTKLIFGDLDGDKIDDAGVTVDGSKIGGGTGQLTWGILKSENVIGISADHGGFANFTGWNVFGDSNLDKGYLGDFNGDGVADRMIYRASTNQVFIDLSVAGNFGDGIPDYGPIALGIPGDKIYVSDINGDGKEDLVVARDTSLSPPPNNTPGLQTLYGYYNDGTGFSTLNGASPSITDFWGAGEGLLFGTITPAPNLAGFKITQITSAGPEIAFSGTFKAVQAGTYQVEASLNLQSWQVMSSLSVAGADPTNFSISDAQLDTTFGPATRSKVFVRITLLP